jgi:MFS superfamily sulfate permease-like transporter
VVAACSGSFVFNGNPTQTQVADSAGGRSQLAQLTTCVAVLLVLLLLTGPLASLPIAALAAIVFLIAVGLIDVAGMRGSWPAVAWSSPSPCSLPPRS